MFKKTVKMKIIDDGKNGNPEIRATIPTYGSDGAAGADVYTMQGFKLEPMKPVLVKLGFKVKVPAGYMLQVCTRSGTAMTDGLFVLNAPGIVDEDYRGEVGVILCWTGVNTTLNKFEIKDDCLIIPAGSRIGQLVMTKVERPIYEVVDGLDSTKRGEGGFGSTGTK